MAVTSLVDEWQIYTLDLLMVSPSYLCFWSKEMEGGGGEKERERERRRYQVP